MNFRPALWRDPEAMRATGREAVANADIVKVSAEELSLLTGLDDEADAVSALWHPRLKVLAVTRGAAGADLFAAGHRVHVPGFMVPVVDTVGCGDAFMATFLAGLLAADIATLDEDTLFQIGRRACAAGALVAGVAGAMEAMPRADNIAAFLATSETRVKRSVAS